MGPQLLRRLLSATWRASGPHHSLENADGIGVRGDSGQQTRWERPGAYPFALPWAATAAWAAATASGSPK